MKEKIVLFILSYFLMIGYASAQTTAISGKVLDVNKEPVIGAIVVVKGTTVGTNTDIDGSFKLNIPQGKDVLMFSLVGYKTVEIKAKSQMVITLEDDTKALDEVMVIAYGTAKRSSFTGSASLIQSQSIGSRPITSVISAIEGNVPGVQTTAATGQPGESAAIRIRGFGSVNASNSPLYVVDGAVYNGSLASINPNDIESMTVLKDAAATALYGSSAGNGVVMITTKRGTANSSVTLNIKQGWSSRAYKDYSRVGISQYYPLQWEMLKNAYVTAGKTQTEAASLASANIASTLKYNPYVGIADGEVVGTDGKLNSGASALKWGDDLDWDDAAFGTGYRQEYTIGYGSKTEKSDTYSSISYLDDKGYMLNTGYLRYSARLNHNINPVDWFKAGVNVGYTRSSATYSSSTADNSSASSNLTRFIRNMAPIYPIHKHDKETGAYLDSNGNVTTNKDEYVYDYEGGRLSSTGRDAIAETEMNSRKYDRNSLVGRTYVTISPIKGLDITSNYALETNDYRAKVYENPFIGDGQAGPGRLALTSSRTTTQTLNQLVNYKKSIQHHNFEALLGHESYKYVYEYMYGMKVSQIFEDVFDFENFTSVNNLTSYTDTYNKEGYFGRLNYDYDNKYYGSFSYRRDGTSRFSKDNRWGNFWSYGASWRISQEDFMKGLTWVDNLKLRASYGETGVDQILNYDAEDDYYPYQTLYNLGENNGTEAGVYFTTLANDKLKWETQISKDLALEFGLFGKLNGSIEYFIKDSKNLLFDVSQATSNGISSIIQNIGKVRNSGVEIDLNYLAFKNKDWKVNIGANATYIKNEIIRMPDVNKNGLISGSKKLIEGRSIYEFWLRQWYGVDSKNGNGLYLLDTDAYNKEDGTLTAAIEKTVQEINGVQVTSSYSYAKFDYSGTSIPKWYGGFNFTIDYKNFTLGTVFSYQLGGKALDLVYANLMSTASYGSSMSTDVLKAWKTEGDVTSVPRLDNTSTYNTSIGQSYSSRWLTSTDYLNLRSVNLSYSVPRSLLSKIQLSEARFSVNAENLFMIKARQGFNPQMNYSGISYNVYMPAKTITLGLNLSF